MRDREQVWSLLSPDWFTNIPVKAFSRHGVMFSVARNILSSSIVLLFPWFYFASPLTQYITQYTRRSRGLAIYRSRRRTYTSAQPLSTTSLARGTILGDIQSCGIAQRSKLLERQLKHGRLLVSPLTNYRCEVCTYKSHKQAHVRSEVNRINTRKPTTGKRKSGRKESCSYT
ncbi:hypothetical protein F4801DRAFT_21185 [Xylaria longipes]|nr:hypothetical protein F4801DRAFT_21185 [Xylaria longipes]